MVIHTFDNLKFIASLRYLGKPVCMVPKPQPSAVCATNIARNGRDVNISIHGGEPFN